MSRPRIDFWYRMGTLVARATMSTFGSLEVVGRENIPPEGPVIFAPNHRSNADPPVMVFATTRPVWFMAKRGLFAGPIASYFLRGVHVYPVDRDGRDLDALRWAQETLNKDRALVLFPEGTRHPGGLGKGTDGLAYLALRSGAPIVPVGITGTEKISGMYRTPVHFKRLKAVFGESFMLPPVEGRIERRVLHAMTNEIMERIAALLPPEYRGVYADSHTESPENAPSE